MRRRKPRPSTGMSRLSVSFDYLRCLTANDRNRADFNDSLQTSVHPRITVYITAIRDLYADLLSVSRLFGRSPRSFKALFSLTGNILQDDLNKTIVAHALGVAGTNSGRVPQRRFHATQRRGGSSLATAQHNRLTRLDPELSAAQKAMLEVQRPLTSPQSLAIAAQPARIASARWEGLARLRADRA